MRLEMLQVARLAPNLLHDARDLVATYIRCQLNADGGFADRAGRSDLYYTVFGLEGLLALREPAPTQRVAAYLHPFGDGEGLDFVHLTCLARCWAALGDFERLSLAPTSEGSEPPPSLRGRAGEGGQSSSADHDNADAPVAGDRPHPNPPPSRGREPDTTPADWKLDRQTLAQRIESFRSGDGGYSQASGDELGTVYACFLAAGAFQDLKLDLPDPVGVIACVRRQKTDDGGYANGPDMPIGTTPTTAAAVTLLRVLNEPADRTASDWLLARAHPEGGFLAMPEAPMPDLLSTAVALHALSGMHIGVDHLKEKCLDYLDSLWVNKGGFYGNWAEDTLDVEYTYYGLLALGHLSL